MSELAPVHDRLKAILAPYRASLSVTRDGPDGLTLEAIGLEGKPWGYVAGTRLGKRSVSFYLMSVYGCPDLLEALSPELRRRMQGKACFNFARIDEGLLAELEALTATAIARHPEVVDAALAASPRQR